MTSLTLDLGLGQVGAGLDENLYDVIIIGGGPGGASAAIYSARADLRTLVIDKGLTAGALGITAKISNYPGVPGPISGAELTATMRAQAESFGATFHTDRVVDVDLTAEPKVIVAGAGTFRAKAVVLATGSMGRAHTVKGEEEFLGRGVSYCATCDGAFFRNRPVAVIGNNDEALEEALFLTKFTDQVHLIVPTANLKAQPKLIDEMHESPGIQVNLDTRLREIVGNGTVQGVRVQPRGGELRTLPVDGAFIYLQGARPITDYLSDQVKSAEKGCLVVDQEMQTTLPGVFAIGDLLCDHIKQAVVAAADGVSAALGADKYINGRKQSRPDWS